MWFEPRGVLPVSEQQALEAELRGFGTLQAVVRWAFSRRPPSDISEVVVQDEYGHDVVLPLRGEVHLVFDTT